MVKADLTRDYYGDLELQPNADVNEIKKQFKKLALTYHPDRNPGRENEVTAKFQRIQSAHEVLIDAQERAKYDAGRIRGNNSNKSTFAGSTASTKGNPYANAGSQWPPPPKAPTARKPPPPSAGAQRYKHFETPKTSANQAAQEGAEARKSTYEAWEHMRNQKPSDRSEGFKSASERTEGVKPGPGRTWRNPPAASKEFTPQSGREESNSFKYAAPPKVRPGYEEFRAGQASGTSPQRRSQSTSSSNRKGFMPNTPGGDEPAAPRGAYFTQRNKPQAPPEPPPRGPPAPMETIDPLKRFRETPDPSFEPRISTPYATHGGEKLNPFDSANLNRSKSSRDRPENSESGSYVPRTGSDPNLTRHSTRTSKGHAGPTVEIHGSSSDDGPEISSQPAPRTRVFAKPRSATTSSREEQQMPNSAGGPDKTRKHSLVSRLQKWFAANYATDLPLKDFPPDAPLRRSGQTGQETNGDPTMYARFKHLSVSEKQRSAYSIKLPTVSEAIWPDKCDSMLDRNPYEFEGMHSTKWPPPFLHNKSAVTPPSGASNKILNAFEGLQRTLLDQLLVKRDYAGNSGDKRCIRTYNEACRVELQPDIQNQKPTRGSHADLADNLNFSDWNTATTGSPSSKQKMFKPICSVYSHNAEPEPSFTVSKGQFFSNANPKLVPRFSFKVGDETFTPTRSQPNAFTSSSAENISTKFTPEDWDGKFEAGGDYFRPELRGTNIAHRPRAQSGSRSRGRSPTKVRQGDPKVVHPPVDEAPTESPGGTKFLPEEWAQSFKPQTFAPPPLSAKPPIPPRTTGRKSKGSTIRPTMGTAAVVDDGESFDEKPLFDGRGSSTPTYSPDAMDVDTPPITNIPTTADGLKVSIDPLKRAAARPQSPTDTESLKVNFDDLKIQDLLPSLDLPKPPEAPSFPQPSNEFERPTRASYDSYLSTFTAYMRDWDLFNSRMMLHLVARKNQNDALGANRWLDDQGLETYRTGQKEDQIVISHWIAAGQIHQLALKNFAIVKERMRDRVERERPRKKAY